MERIEVNGKNYKLNRKYKKPFDEFIDEFRDTKTYKNKYKIRHI